MTIPRMLLSLVVVMLSVTFAAPGISDKGVTFGKKYAKKGRKRVAEASTNMSMTIEVSGRTMKLASDKQTKVHYEVLKVVNDAIVKVKIKYEKAQKTSSNSAGSSGGKEDLPVHGKTYILTKYPGKKAVVTDASGNKVPAEEEEYVIDRNSEYGEKDRWISGMPTHALKPGDRVPGLEKALKDEVAARQKAKGGKGKGRNMSISKVRIHFKRKKGKVGVFDVRLTMTLKERGVMTATVPLSGTMSMRIADSWPMKLKVAGPLTVSPDPNGKGPPVSGNGTVSMHSANSYPP